MVNPIANDAQVTQGDDKTDLDALQERVRQMEQRLQLIEKTLVAMELRFGGGIPDGNF